MILQSWVSINLHHSTQEIPALFPLLATKIQAGVKTIEDFINILATQIQKAFYKSSELQKIKDRFWPLIEPFLEGKKFNGNFELMGNFISKISPLLHFKFKFGGLQLKNLILKLQEPLLNPKWSISEKTNFKKLLPKIVQGLIYAVQDFEKDDFLKKILSDILKLSMEKYESKDLEQVLILVWNESKTQIFFMRILMKLQNLQILMKSLELCKNLESYENFIRFSFEWILEKHLQNLDAKESMSKKLTGQIIVQIFEVCDRNRGSNCDFSHEIKRILVEYVRKNSDLSNHKNVTKMTNILKKLSERTFLEVYPILENSAENLKRRFPQAGIAMESELKRQKI